MIKKKLFFLLLFSSYILSQAQIAEVKIALQNPNIQWENSASENYIETLINDKNLSVQLLHATSSPLGKHLLYQVEYGHTAIYGAQIKLNINQKNQLYLVSFPEFIQQNISVENQSFKSSPQHFAAVVSDMPVYFFDNRLLKLGRLVVTYNAKTFAHTEYLLYKNDIIQEKDLHLYHDSTATAYVFNPDPLTTAHATYGIPFIDAFDASNAAFETQKQMVNINCNYQSGIFYLNNNFVEIADFDPPTVPPATSANGIFNFNRFQDGFEDVNAFYHISFFHDYLINLGFNLVNYPLKVDAHAVSGADNSYFNFGANPPQLHFGEGGVDDAEDADVIIHEYGHAIAFSAAPGTNNGLERASLDEGFGDYLATSYSRSLDEYNWANMFSWDGHNEFWNGRYADVLSHYPENLSTNIYTNGAFWNAVMMKIWESLGREVTDKLHLQAMYMVSANMSLADAAQLILEADKQIFEGEHLCLLGNILYEYGLLTQQNDCSHVKLINENAFAPSKDYLVMQLPISDLPYEVKIYDTNGRLVDESLVYSDTGIYRIAKRDLASGIYILQVIHNHVSYSFKMIQ